VLDTGRTRISPHLIDGLGLEFNHLLSVLSSGSGPSTLPRSYSHRVRERDAGLCRTAALPAGPQAPHIPMPRRLAPPRHHVQSCRRRGATKPRRQLSVGHDSPAAPEPYLALRPRRRGRIRARLKSASTRVSGPRGRMVGWCRNSALFRTRPRRLQRKHKIRRCLRSQSRLVAEIVERPWPRSPSSRRHDANHEVQANEFRHGSKNVASVSSC